ncbi:MAG: diguanylate cyclase [Desulfuromonadales bacterium]
MTMTHHENLNPPELLETLHGYPFLADFSLALKSPEGHLLAFRGKKLKLCEDSASGHPCGNCCQTDIEQARTRVLRHQRFHVVRCPLGLLWAVIPLQAEKTDIGYLICSGKRETLVDMNDIQSLVKNSSGPQDELISEWKNLPAISRKDIEAIAEKTHKLLNSLLSTSFSTFALQKNLNRLKSIAGITSEIDRVKSLDSLCDLLNETLSILFDVPRIIYLLPSERNPSLWETGKGDGIALSLSQMEALHRTQDGQTCFLDERKIQEQLPFLENISRTYSIPLSIENTPLGHLFLCDTELHQYDMVLIDLLIGRMAAKLLHLKRDKDVHREKTLSSRLLTAIAELSSCNNRTELYHKLLELSAKLLGATKGSVMLCDEERKALHIEAALGMNPQLAQRLNVQIGGSYAGRVLNDGKPLLVENIEKHSDMSINSRPRFNTNSFLSFPLLNGETTVGVLNLSDKKDGGFFTDTDKDNLSALTVCFSGLLRGATAQEQVSHLEELSMTDPLTGLHNRRFLTLRMEEELNRSSRQELNLAVMMIDIDHFKKYNDLCGHLAGDQALEKLAAILKGSSRVMDVVTRFGGEEFCIVLPGASRAETGVVAARIQETIEQETFVAEELLPLGRLTASIGIAFFPRDGKTPDGLLSAADGALYKAKAAGRNAISVYQPESAQQLPFDSNNTEEYANSRSSGESN